MLNDRQGLQVCGQLREELADLLAALPAVSRATDTSAGTAAVCSAARAVYCQLRTVENVSAWLRLNGAAPPPQCFDAAALCEAFCAGAAQLCRFAVLRYTGASRGMYLAGNGGLFTVCLGNLLCNALLYGAERPQIEVALARGRGRMALTVRDDGKGILPVQVQAALRPFVSLDPYGDSPVRPGLGLGLALAQRYASVYGGALLVRSIFGEGTQVRLTAPCAPQPAAQPAPEFLCDTTGPLYVQLAPVCTLPV